MFIGELLLSYCKRTHVGSFHVLLKYPPFDASWLWYLLCRKRHNSNSFHQKNTKEELYSSPICPSCLKKWGQMSPRSGWVKTITTPWKQWTVRKKVSPSSFFLACCLVPVFSPPTHVPANTQTSSGGACCPAVSSRNAVTWVPNSKRKAWLQLLSASTGTRWPTAWKKLR